MNTPITPLPLPLLEETSFSLFNKACSLRMKEYFRHMNHMDREERNEVLDLIKLESDLSLFYINQLADLLI